MNERMRFVLRLESGERMTDLCNEFGISRKTGYKIYTKFKSVGVNGLFDESKKPLNNPRQVSREVEGLILKLKDERPTWGADKLKAFLEMQYSETNFPSRNTFFNILLKNNLTKKRSKRSNGYKATGTALRQTLQPNDLWCVDFKGDYFLKNKQKCFPLTLSDHFSRYVLSCTALETKSMGGVFDSMDEAFSRYGLPVAIRSDNGTPFSSTAILGLSKLSVWWMKLGIEIELSRPASPQDNGRHERMHRTLKEDILREKAKSILHQQEIFDEYILDFNKNRPHAAIDNKTPAAVYKSSDKKLCEKDYNYEECDEVKRVSKCGSVPMGQKKKFFLSEAVSYEQIGLKEVGEKIWRVQFRGYNPAT